MLIAPRFIATTSGAYKLAVATAQRSPQFTEILGPPVSEEWFSEGKEQLGNSAKAELLIPVRGQKRHGQLRALAFKNAGRWQLEQLTLELTLPDERINLLESAPITDQNQP